jgi:hypothetical protein
MVVQLSFGREDKQVGYMVVQHVAALLQIPDIFRFSINTVAEKLTLVFSLDLQASIVFVLLNPSQDGTVLFMDRNLSLTVLLKTWIKPLH